MLTNNRNFTNVCQVCDGFVIFSGLMTMISVCLNFINLVQNTCFTILHTGNSGVLGSSVKHIRLL